MPGLAASNQIKGQELQTKIIPLLTFPTLLLSLFISFRIEPRGTCDGSALPGDSSWPHTKDQVLRGCNRQIPGASVEQRGSVMGKSRDLGLQRLCFRT